MQSSQEQANIVELLPTATLVNLGQVEPKCI
jgi:hypothetical protein